MKRTILTIMLPTLLLSSPVLAEPNLFDALFNTIQQHPKTTLLFALAGCAASYGFGYKNACKSMYNYGYKKGCEQGFAEAIQQGPKLLKNFNNVIKELEKLEEYSSDSSDSSKEEPSLSNAIKAKGKKIKKKSEKAIKRLTS